MKRWGIWMLLGWLTGAVAVFAAQCEHHHEDEAAGYGNVPYGGAR